MAVDSKITPFLEQVFSVAPPIRTERPQTRRPENVSGHASISNQWETDSKTS